MRLCDFVPLQKPDVSAVGKETREFGTRVSGFVHGKVGPFECGTCLHFDGDACNHPTVMADPEVKKNDHGDAIVDADDRCKFWWPKKK